MVRVRLVEATLVPKLDWYSRPSLYPRGWAQGPAKCLRAIIQSEPCLAWPSPALYCQPLYCQPLPCSV